MQPITTTTTRVGGDGLPADFLVINISEIYLITLANSALYRAESETIENSLFFGGHLENRKMLNT